MTRAGKLFSVFLATHLPAGALAFDIATHARITQNAIWQSEIATSSVLADIGLSRRASTSLGTIYLDISANPATAASARGTYLYDWAGGAMPGVAATLTSDPNPQLLTYPEGWMMRGTIREDDGGPIYDPGSPHDDPQGDLHRFCNHFYDPVNNTKLTTFICRNGILDRADLTSAPVWALGVAGLADPPGGITKPLPLSPPDVTRRNHYSFQDAREAMWRALTLKQFRDQSGSLQTDPAPPGSTGNGSLKELPPPSVPTGLGGSSVRFPAKVFSPDAAVARKQYRDGYWATTFFSLGSVLHLNQDMAQPQHTRIEIHPAGWRKNVEAYLESRALSDTIPGTYTTTFEGIYAPVPLRPLVYQPPDSAVWAPPAFADLSDYWSAPLSGSIADGLGLGDFSNSHFFSPAHNLNEGTYQLPLNTAASYVPEVSGDAAGIRHRYLRGIVHDPLYRTSHSIRMTRLTAIGGAMLDLGREPAQGTGRSSYILDTAVLDDYAKLLIPRAVSYSAGLINYFFRGKLQIGPPDSGIYGIVDHSRFAPNNPDGYQATDNAAGFKGFDRIKLKLANVTPAITLPGGNTVPQEMTDGVLVAVAKFHRNYCYDDLLATLPVSATDAMQRNCRSPNEEIVVSAPLVNQSVPAATPGAPLAVELAFDFSSQEIPINAWDVVLQVVYRGRLGQESDAVVVATLDLSEPTFFGLFNASDNLVALDGVLYTPAGLNADQGAFAKVDPSCKRLSAGIYTLSEACYNFPDTFAFTTGSEAAPGVTIQATSQAAIEPRHFARVAVLSGAADGMRLRWNAAAVTCWHFLDNPVIVQPQRAQLDVDNFFYYQNPTVFRGVNNTRAEYCFPDVGVELKRTNGVFPVGFDVLQTLDEKAPRPLTITGW